MKKSRLFLAASLACAVAGLPAVSSADSLQMPDTYYYVGGHVSEYFYDFNSHLSTNDDSSYNPNDGKGLTNTTLPGLQFGWRFAPRFSVQGSWERHDFSFEDSSFSGNMSTYLLSARYHYRTSWLGFEPYAGLSGGRLRLGSNSQDASIMETMIGPEFGAQAMLLPYLSLDVGARPLYATHTHRWDGEIYAGLNFILGAKGQHAEKQVAQEAAPAPAPVVAAPVAAAAVAAAVVDTDGDGVPDSKDKCPNTPKGAVVDETGCPKMLTKDIRQTLHVQFATSKAVVSQASYADIQKVADLVKQYPSATMTLDGYTDNRGSAVVNQRLSQERAEAVKDVLVKHFGVDGSHITVAGHGDANPVASNKTVQGRAENRRVEVTLKAQTQQVQSAQ